MRINETLTHLSRLMESWKIDSESWILTGQYADQLQGYKVKPRKNHLNILIHKNKLPWKINKTVLEVYPPIGSKYGKQFTKFIKEAGFDFDILPFASKEFSIKKKQTVRFPLSNKNNILLLKPIGELDLLEDILKRSNEKGWGTEKGKRILDFVEEFSEEQKLKGDKEVSDKFYKVAVKYKHLKTGEILKPTVKRDISFFSVESWQRGYREFLKKNYNWSYDTIFHYDGSRVNFYHKLSDFKYFKEIITERLLKDQVLFEKLNTEFKKVIKKLKSFEKGEISFSSLKEISSLMGKAMSFYVFIVSDKFLERQPKALESRNMSEDILYKLDEKVEKFLGLYFKGKKTPHLISLNEILSYEKNKKLNIKQICERQKGYILFNNKFILNSSFNDFCQKHGFHNPEQDVLPSSNTLEGQIAFRGKAKGRVKIVNTKDDMDKVSKGDILISVMTNANYIPAMAKAQAIITDEGGIMCHAAIVARELKIPCIIGTKIATKVLKDGDMVELDAEKGIVRILNR